MKRWLIVGATIGAVWSLLGLALITVPAIRETINTTIGAWMTYLPVLFPTTFLALLLLHGYYVFDSIDWAVPIMVTGAVGGVVGASVAWGLWRWRRGRRGRR
jgi:hypothetical protein